MSEREYMGICAQGHRSYLRLVPVPDMQGRCPRCGEPAELFPPGRPFAGQETNEGRLSDLEIRIRERDPNWPIEWTVLVNGQAVVGGTALDWLDAFEKADEQRRREAGRPA